MNDRLVLHTLLLFDFNCHNYSYYVQRGKLLFGPASSLYFSITIANTTAGMNSDIT